MTAATLVTIPAVLLRVACTGNACVTAGGRPAQVPFCPLPAAVKDGIEAGYRSGRAPDVLGVTGRVSVVGGTVGASPTGLQVPWPSLFAGADDSRVPIVFGGPALSGRASVPSGTGLDAIAPTIASVLRFDRPHPQVRAGAAVAGVTTDAPPRLVLEVAWKGVGSIDLERRRRTWSYLRSLMHGGDGTLDGETGSLPLDPAATLTTIGTGGLPFQHGITGTLIRNRDDRVVPAWGSDAPPSVIATLPDDFDHLNGERPLVGLVATNPSDRGIVGDGWYVSRDDDPVRVADDPNGQVAAVRGLVALGFGRDDTPDILAVVMQGPIAALDRELRDVVAAAERAAGGSLLVVVAGTGATASVAARSVAATQVVSEVNSRTGSTDPIVQAAIPGGLFIDQSALAAAGVSGQVVQEALAGVPSPSGGALMAQSFQGFAVSFARYC